MVPSFTIKSTCVVVYKCKSKCKDTESLTSTGASGRHEAWRLLTVNDCAQLNVFYTTVEISTRNECSLFNALCSTDLSIQNHNKHIDHTADRDIVYSCFSFNTANNTFRTQFYSCCEELSASMWTVSNTYNNDSRQQWRKVYSRGACHNSSLSFLTSHSTRTQSLAR